MPVQNNISVPTVSVIMSVYNEPIDWIQQAADSILNQTFTDFEFIIINDKPDREENKTLLSELSEKDRRIRVVNNPENIGLTASLNKGIQLAKGNYIARMDADDISLENRFREQVQFLESNLNIGICGTDARIIDKEGTVTNKMWLYHKSEVLKASIISYCPFIHPTIMGRRHIFEANKYDENCRVAQDWNLWLRLVESVQFANIPKVLFHYRIHQCQSQVKAGAERSIKSRMYADSIFADKLSLEGEIRKLFIKSRSDEPMSLQELDRLYDYLFKMSFDGKSRTYAMCKFISVLKNKCGIQKLFSSKTVKKNPALFIQALLFYFGGLIRIRL